MSTEHTKIFSLDVITKQVISLNEKHYKSVVIMKCEDIIYVDKILILLTQLTNMNFVFSERLSVGSYKINIYHNDSDILKTITKLDKSLWILKDNRVLYCDGKRTKRHYSHPKYHHSETIFLTPIILEFVEKIIMPSSKILLNDGEYYIHNPY